MMVTMVCCDAKYPSVELSMSHTCEDNVKIVMTTERPGERKGRIESAAMARSAAIKVLSDTFDLSVNGWMFNTQAQVKGETLWMWTLVTQ